MAKLPTLELQVDIKELTKVVEMVRALGDATKKAGAIIDAAVAVVAVAIEELQEEVTMEEQDTMIPKTWACSTCGQPATHAVRDEILQPSKPGDIMAHYHAGEVRYGCAKHPEVSQIIKPASDE